PNVDLVYHAGTADPAQVEYDYVVNPGGDPNAIQFTVLGAQSLNTDAQGDLQVTTPGSVLTASVPAVSQTVNGVQQLVHSSFAITSGNVVSLQVSGYDPTQSLTIDPVLTFSTYLGGSGTDIGNGIAVDAAGNVYVTGSTTSTNFPGVSGSLNGTQD